MKHLYTIFLYAYGIALAVLVWLERDASCYQRQFPQPPSKFSETAKSPDVSQNTLTDIRQNLSRREYYITYDEVRQSLQSPNRRHNLRAYYEPGRLTIQTRVDSVAHHYKLELVNKGIYADGNKIFKPQFNAPVENRADTLHINHPHFTEEFINNEVGIRQNFIIHYAPAGTKQLQVRLQAKGLKVHESKENVIEFYQENGGILAEDKLTYQDLKCWDAKGRPLAADLSASNNHISISVDVKDAIYPVTIDPIIANGTPANANKTVEINQSYAWFGFSVSSAGDVNGDGFSDVIIGAPNYDNGQTDEGAAFVFPGTAGGLSLAGTLLQSNQAYAQMGYAVSSAGDINKDGYSDVLVGAPYYDGSASNEGLVFVYKGSNTGISINNPYMITLDQAEAGLGISVALAGDVNGDGFSDILAGAHQFDHNELNEGVGVLIYGAPNGLGLVTFLEGNQPGAMMGFAVAGAGDINGDGFSDVMIGARLYSHDHALEGAAFIFKGSAQGVVTANPLVIESNQADARMGHALASAGDVNGDGYADIAIGAYQYDKGQSNEGVVFIHYGSFNGVSSAPALTLEGNQNEAQLGISVACAGDVNGDGFAELIAGTRYYSKGQNHEGAAFIYHGSKTGLDPIPASTLESNQADAWLGSAVASAGDINGDGFSDVMVGAYAFDNGQKDEGSVFIWHGRADGVINSNHVATTLTGEDQTFSIAGAGDVNGDGFSDLIVGASDFNSNGGSVFIYHGSASGINTNPTDVIENVPNTENFGFSVAGAGDVNGDGYDDVIIGDVGYFVEIKPQSLEIITGAALIYYGSSQGIDKNTSTVLKSKKSTSLMGYAVAAAGDVDGDGYDDVIVGDESYDNGNFDEGAAFVYHGSQTGINPLEAIVIEGDQDFAQLGYSVSGGGDINHDGYADIMIGAPYYSNGQATEGVVFVYYGSQTGLSKNSFTKLEKDQINAGLGVSVASAGDVNGDGYSDIIAGADKFDNMQNGEGAALLYYGSSTGANSAQVVVLECNQADARMGESVSGAGDLNGDGYSDLIISVPNYYVSPSIRGAAFIYYGFSSGIQQNANPSFILQNINPTVSYQALQQKVAYLGDVNADGYGDVIADYFYFNYDNLVQKSIGLIYHGNRTGSAKNNLRLYNTDLTTTINHNQFAQNDFGAGLFAKSFLGNNKGKLVWETKATGQGFSKGSSNFITNSVQSSGSQNSYSNLGVAGTELKSVIPKQGPATKVRTRVKYDPVLAMTGQMYGPWRYLPAYLQGNSASPAPKDAIYDLSEIANQNEIGKNAKDTNNVSTFPNPASDQLHIHTKNPEEIQSIRLLTSAGETVYQSQGIKQSINLKGRSAGTYILVITNKDGSKTTHRIVVNP